MHRSAKEQIASTPDQLISGGLRETGALQASGLTDTEITSDYSSTSEQLKRTPRKPYR